MITDAEYVLWCACRLKNKYGEENSIWRKLYKIGEALNKKDHEDLKEKEEVERQQKKIEELISYDYSNIEGLVK